MDMSEQELAEIRDRVTKYRNSQTAQQAHSDVTALLAEVERLRGQAVVLTREHCRSMDERDAARAKVAALREIAQAVAKGDEDDPFVACAFCERERYIDDHAPDCPVTRARALLGETHEQKASEE